MVCHKCTRAGYYLKKIDNNKYICPTCERGEEGNLITSATVGSAPNPGIRMTSLDSLATPGEWREIAKLCKQVGSTK